MMTAALTMTDERDVKHNDQDKKVLGNFIKLTAEDIDRLVKSLQI